MGSALGWQMAVLSYTRELRGRMFLCWNFFFVVIDKFIFELYLPKIWNKEHFRHVYHFIIYFNYILPRHEEYGAPHTPTPIPLLHPSHLSRLPTLPNLTATILFSVSVSSRAGSYSSCLRQGRRYGTVQCGSLPDWSAVWTCRPAVSRLAEFACTVPTVPTPPPPPPIFVRPG